MDNKTLRCYLKTPVLHGLVLFFAIAFFLLTPVGRASGGEPGETLSFSGVVKTISLTEQTLVVKPEEERKKQIFFTGKTLYTGVAGADEIKVKHKVRIWYVREDKLLKALKIKVMPELGC